MWFTQLWNVAFDQLQLHKLGQWTGAIVTCHKNRPPFLGHYGDLHYADVSLLLNKNVGSQFGLVQRCDGARHIQNSVR